mgnify:CR=1 FL=1
MPTLNDSLRIYVHGLSGEANGQFAITALTVIAVALIAALALTARRRP